jgi:hypothetical protein
MFFYVLFYFCETRTYSEVKEGVELYLYFPTFPTYHSANFCIFFLAYERKYVFCVGLHEIY